MFIKNFFKINKDILIIILFILCLIFGSISTYYLIKDISKSNDISYQVLSQMAVNKCKLPKYRGNRSETECLNLAIKESHIYEYFNDNDIPLNKKNNNKLPQNEEECNITIEKYKEKISEAYDSGNQSEYKRLNDEAENITNHCLNLMSN